MVTLPGTSWDPPKKPSPMSDGQGISTMRTQGSRQDLSAQFLDQIDSSAITSLKALGKLFPLSVCLPHTTKH